MSSFAYLFERFPSFTQTFCYREVMEMKRQGADVPVYSIRRPDTLPQDCPANLAAEVQYLPEASELGRQMRTFRMLGRYPWPVILEIRTWGKKRAKSRLLEAAWLGPKLRRAGIRHVHAHFAGIGAQTALWLKRFYGMTFSFTGHANDMFCDSGGPIGLEDLVREASFVVVVSDFTRSWLDRRVPGFSGKIHRIYNGMDIESLKPSDPMPGRPRIISVGRYIEKKGFGDLIAACGLLRNSGLDFECEIIGGGPLEPVLKELVARVGLENHVRITGPQPQEVVREKLSSATLFVLACATEPSGGMDTLPTVIVEAMAAGLPVVSTRLAAVPEMVEQGITGFLVGQNQPGELAEAIRNILSDSEMCKKFGQAGKKLARERFSSAPTVEALRSLLERHSAV